MGKWLMERVWGNPRMQLQVSMVIGAKQCQSKTCAQKRLRLADSARQTDRSGEARKRSHRALGKCERCARHGGHDWIAGLTLRLFKSRLKPKRVIQAGASGTRFHTEKIVAHFSTTASFFS